MSKQALTTKIESETNYAKYFQAKYRGIPPAEMQSPPFRQSSANILVAIKASSMLAPEATTAQTIAPAEEPANGVVSWKCITKLTL